MTLIESEGHSTDGKAIADTFKLGRLAAPAFQIRAIEVIAVSALRAEPTDSRLAAALDNPKRRPFADPLDHRLECLLGRLRVSGKITEAEYNAGVRWREIYLNWLASIGAPSPFPAAMTLAGANCQTPLGSKNFDDERCEAIAKAMRAGEKVLKGLGNRVFHSVNAVVVYEEPEELGDFESTAYAAKKGLAALADLFS
jgi:hypothetical protein